MKIGLITIHNVTNYGAILQAYATIEALSKYGDVTVINYQKKHLSHHMDLFRFNASKRGVKMLVHDGLNYFSRSKMLSRFKKFIEQNMKVGEKVTLDELMKGNLSDFDLYVCGSDQIWNPNVVSADHTLDPIFFLSFVPQGERKISFASSIGNHFFSEAERPLVKELLENFNNISVREEDGLRKLKEILPQKKITQVVDPTLLFSKSEWLQKFKINSNNQDQKYILVYSVPRTELIRKAITFYSNKLGYEVVAIDKMLMSMPNVDRHIRDAGPKEFIELFAGASFVITDSFHGLCFSINFEKPFAAVSSNKVGNRQENLLNLMGMQDRLVRNEEDFENINLDLINTLDKRKTLQSLREDSHNYLSIALNGE